MGRAENRDERVSVAAVGSLTEGLDVVSITALVTTARLESLNLNFHRPQTEKSRRRKSMKLLVSFVTSS